jgi:2-polyprenyl-6-methoxyphenol hydroxylase-like FAD-dependent oxidoreductase
MKILIVGAGIGGLTLAAFLKRQNIEYEIIDKTPDWNHLGYAIAIWHSGRVILEKLGIAKAFDAHGHQVSEHYTMDSTGKPFKLLDFSKVDKKYQPVITVIKRTDLHAILLKAAASKVTMNCTVDAVVQSDKDVTVTFSNGKQKTYDLVVGTDGIKSSIRNAIFPGHDPIYSGWRLYYFWFDSHKFQFPDTLIEAIEHKEMLSVFPLKNGLACGILAMPHKPGELDVPKTRLKRLRAYFKDLRAVVDGLLADIDNPDDIAVADIAHINLEKWHKNRIVLLGDSAHAIEPYIGIGASLAMEDAFVLSEELGNVNKNQSNLEAILNRYQERRTDRVALARQQNSLSWKLTMLRSATSGWLRTAIIHFILTRKFTSSLTRLIDGEL